MNKKNPRIRSLAKATRFTFVIVFITALTLALLTSYRLTVAPISAAVGAPSAAPSVSDSSVRSTSDGDIAVASATPELYAEGETETTDVTVILHFISHVDGVDTALTETKTVPYNNSTGGIRTYFPPETYKPIGYTIDYSYNTEPDGTGTSYDTGTWYQIPAEPGSVLHFYYQYNILEIPVTYYYSGRPSGVKPECLVFTDTVIWDTPYITPIIPDEPTYADKIYGENKRYYHFVGWDILFQSVYDSQTRTTRVNVGEEILNPFTKTAGGEKMFAFAVWEPDVYTIRYNANQPATASEDVTGTMADQQIEYYYQSGRFLSKNQFACTGFEFLGWSTDPNATDYQFHNGCEAASLYPLVDATEDGSIDLYAVWKPIEYQIRFSKFPSTGVYGNVDTMYMKYGEEAALNANAFTRSDYKFIGWSTTEGGEVVYTDKQLVKNLAATDYAYITLYPVWDKATYTIRYVAPEGAEGEMADQIAYCGEYVTLTPNAFTLEGHYFSKWTFASGYKCDDGATISSRSNTDGAIVYANAQFAPNNYTIDYKNTLNANQYFYSQSFQYGTPKAIDPGVTPRDPNGTHTFIGWDTDPSGSTVVYRTGDIINLPVPNKTSITLYTVWETKKFTITWANWDGTVLETDIVEAGTVPTYDGETPTRPDTDEKTYTFWGWSPNKIVAATEDATYTAFFTGSTKKYTVTWKNDDGTVLETDENVAYGTTPTYDGETPTKAADEQYTYTFKGWTPEVAPVTGDAVYTAVYDSAAITCTVTFMDSTDDAEIAKVSVNKGEAVTAPTAPTHEGLTFLRWATEKNGATEAELSNISGDMTVWAVYEAPSTPAPTDVKPYVVFEKASKTFNTNETIKFKAVGSWITGPDYVEGDTYYVPVRWHHAEPSGDFGGKTAPTDDYSGSFTQAAAGTYTLKVEFQKYVYESGAWSDKGIVTVDTDYRVVAPSGGDTDNTPKTGDNMVIFNINLILIMVSAVTVVFTATKRRRQSNAR